RYAAIATRNLPALAPAVLRTAERIGREEDLARGLAILEGLGTAEARLYRAFLLAGHGHLDAAMDALRAAAAAGGVSPDRLRNDPRLAPLRARADFRALLE